MTKMNHSDAVRYVLDRLAESYPNTSLKVREIHLITQVLEDEGPFTPTSGTGATVAAVLYQVEHYYHGRLSLNLGPSGGLVSVIRNS